MLSGGAVLVLSAWAGKQPPGTAESHLHLGVKIDLAFNLSARK